MKKAIAVLISVMTLISPVYVESARGSNQNTVNKRNVEFLNGLSSIRAQMNGKIYKEGIAARYGKPNKVCKLKNNRSYEIRNAKDGSKLFVFYNAPRKIRNTYKETVYDMWRLKKLLKTDDFKQIKVGKSNFTNVKKIDHYCGIISVSGAKAMSETRLKDNKSIIINYKKKGKSWKVSKINYVKTQLTGFTMLLPADLAEISK